MSDIFVMVGRLKNAVERIFGCAPVSRDTLYRPGEFLYGFRKVTSVIVKRKGLNKGVEDYCGRFWRVARLMVVRIEIYKTELEF